MSLTLVPQENDTLSIVGRLIDIADAIFERATKLEEFKVKKDDEAVKTIAELRDDGFRGVIEVWSVILDMLPVSGIEHTLRRNLEIDAHKVISRCHHRLGHLEKARESITRAIDLGYWDGFISLGAICLDLRDHDSAKAAFESALAKGVQTQRAHAGLGELYFTLGTNALKEDPAHTHYFERAEDEFITAGKERFTESYERAMELFEAIGWRERAIAIGEKAVKYYDDHRHVYGGHLRGIDQRLRKLAGEERYEKVISGVAHTLGNLLGGKNKEPVR